MGKPKSQDDSDDSLQLSIYAVAAREKWGYQVDKLVFHNIEDNTAVETFRNDPALESAKTEVLDVARQIAHGSFEPRKSFNCRYCPYRNLCPATEVRMFSGVSSDAQDSGKPAGKK